MVERAINDPFLEWFFARIPRHVAASFTDDQLFAIKGAFATRWRGTHTVDLRFSLPLLVGRFYFVFVVGPERRGRNRRQVDANAHPLTTLANTLFLVAFSLFLLSALAGILYVLKSALGIDLMPGVSLGVWTDIREQLRLMLR